MPKVNIQHQLTVPAIPARSAISSILHEIADGTDAWADFSLYATLGSLGLPDVGYVAVPVNLKLLGETTEPRHEITFTVHARRSPESFPVFDGALGVDATGPSQSLMWLAGDYTVPLQGIGVLFDKTIGRGTAEKSLENLLETLADAVVARVERKEMAESRYRLIFRSGD